MAKYTHDSGFASAHAVLEPYVAEVYDAFVSYGSGLKKFEGIEVRVSPDARDGARHFAATRTDGKLILLSPDLVDLPPETAVGIIAHEFGHAGDFLYPCAFARDRNGKAVLLDLTRKGARRDEALPADWVEDWESRDDDEVEKAADRIAETILGIRIGYSGPCLLQTVYPVGSRVRRRPEGLR